MRHAIDNLLVVGKIGNTVIPLLQNLWTGNFNEEFSLQLTRRHPIKSQRDLDIIEFGNANCDIWSGCMKISH